MLNGKNRPKVKNGIFSGKKCRFWILAKNPKTNTTLLQPKNLNFHIPESDLQYVAKRSPQETKMAFLGHFLAKNGLFGRWGQPQNNYFFRFFNGQQQSQVQLPFSRFGFFQPFLADFQVFVKSLKIQKLTPPYYSGKF